MAPNLTLLTFQWAAFVKVPSTYVYGTSTLEGLNFIYVLLGMRIPDRGSIVGNWADQSIEGYYFDFLIISLDVLCFV